MLLFEAGVPDIGGLVRKGPDAKQPPNYFSKLEALVAYWGQLPGGLWGKFGARRGLWDGGWGAGGWGTHGGRLVFVFNSTWLPGQFQACHQETSSKASFTAKEPPSQKKRRRAT